MKIIISPAKNMRNDISFSQKLNTPVFINKTSEIFNRLKELNKDELTKLWKCNSKMVNELYDELHKANLSNNLTPAIFTYDGLVYKNITNSTEEMSVS